MRVVTFIPRLCEDDGVTYCKGCDYKKKIEQQCGCEIRCGKDYLEKYREGLGEDDGKVFGDLANRLRDKGSGFLSIEEPVRYAWQVIDTLNVLGPNTPPIPLKIEPAALRSVDVRASELNSKCAAEVFLKRKKAIPEDKKLIIAAKRGRMYHKVGLQDYDFEEGTVAYLPNYFLDDKKPCKRANNCEVLMNFDLEYGGEKISLGGTLDAAFQIGNYGLIVDFKPNAPPFYPSSGHVQQIAMYGIMAEWKTGIKVKAGLIIYREKLGKGFSLRAFSLDENTVKGGERRESAKDFAYKIFTNVQIFENDLQELILYRDSIKTKCFSKKRKTGEIVPKCYNYKFCWGNGLEAAIEALESSKKQEVQPQT